MGYPKQLADMGNTALFACLCMQQSHDRHATDRLSICVGQHRALLDVLSSSSCDALPPSRAFKSTWDRLGNEAFIFGQLAFDWATPTCLRDHLPWFTALALMVRISRPFLAIAGLP